MGWTGGEQNPFEMFESPYLHKINLHLCEVFKRVLLINLSIAVPNNILSSCILSILSLVTCSRDLAQNPQPLHMLSNLQLQISMLL